MSLATHSGQLFQVTIVPLDNCSSQNLFLRSFTNGHLQRGRSLEWTIEYLPQLLQSLISLTDDNRKNKDQNSNKRFALFTLSSYFTLYKMSFLRKNMSYKMFENHCCRNSIVTWLWRHLFVRVVLSRVKFMFSCPVIFLSQQTQLWLLYWQNGAQLYFQSICAAEYE